MCRSAVRALPLVALALVLALFGCGPKADRPVEQVRRVMGQLVTIQAWGPPGMSEAVDAAFQEMEELDRMLSVTDPGSHLMEVNRGARAFEAKVDPRLMDLLKDCRDWWVQSDGLIDPTLGPALDLWGIPSGEGPGTYSPPLTALQRSMRLVGLDKVVLNDINGTIKFDQPEMSLNFDAVKLGFAIDRATDILKNAGARAGSIRSERVSRFFGLNPEGGTWPVELMHPRDPERTLTTLEVADGAVAIVADHHQRFFVRSNQKYYTAILDPQTGLPVEKSIQAATLSETGAFDAQAGAMAGFVLGRADGGQLIRRIDGLEMVIVDHKGDGSGGIRAGATRGLRDSISLDL